MEKSILEQCRSTQYVDHEEMISVMQCFKRILTTLKLTVLAKEGDYTIISGVQVVLCDVVMIESCIFTFLSTVWPYVWSINVCVHSSNKF